jgi:hypothetical protein
MAPAACPAAGGYAWHRATGRWRGGGAQPVHLALRATPPGPSTHANSTGYGVIAPALERQLPLTGPAPADQLAREGRVP